MQKKIVVVGGGFFGMYIAEYFAKNGHDVELYEKEPNFMMRASFNNQARVHNGYHYPRSILTALRSRVSFPRFVDEFSSCVDSDFEKYYLICNQLGKVTANQFSKFCERIGASCEPAPTSIQKLVNPTLVDACYSVREFAFDAIKLRDVMLERLKATSAKLCLSTSVDNVRPDNDGLIISLTNTISNEKDEVYADHVFNCTYSRVNYMLTNSNIPNKPQDAVLST